MPDNKYISSKRKQIDEIDEKILYLLNDRAKLSLEIRDIKKDEGIALFDAKREEEIIKTLNSKNKGPLFKENVRHIFKEIIKTMRGLPDAK